MGAAFAGFKAGKYVYDAAAEGIGNAIDGTKRFFGGESDTEELNRITLGAEQNKPENIERAKVLRSKIMRTPEGRVALTGKSDGKLPANLLSRGDPFAIEYDPNAPVKPTDNNAPVPKPKPKQLGGRSLMSVANAGEVVPNGAPTITNPDGENKPSGTAPSGNATYAAKTTTGLTAASGPLSDGRSSSGFVKLAQGVRLEGVNPEFEKLFRGAAEEYGNLTKKSVTVTSGFRTYAEQAAMRSAKGGMAAMPGTSPHEVGLGIDADSKTLDEMDKLGLMRKYGLTRPVGGEPWHVEPIGILGNIARYRNDPNAASEAIRFGIGKGGAGLGADRSSTKVKRDMQNALSIMNTNVTPRAIDNAISDGTYAASQLQEGETNVESKATGAQTRSDKALPQQPQRGLTTSPLAVPTSPPQMDNEKKPFTPPPAPYNATTMPSPNAATGGNSDVKAVIEDAAKKVGVDPNMMKTIMAIESGMKNVGKSGTSSASGMGQMVTGTWNAMIKKYGHLYGFDENTPRSDMRASAAVQLDLPLPQYESPAAGNATSGAGGKT